MACGLGLSGDGEVWRVSLLVGMDGAKMGRAHGKVSISSNLKILSRLADLS